MKNNLTVFNNEAFGQIRTMIIDDEPWFVGKDIAEALGYAKARNAIADHVAEDDARKQGVIDSIGRMQETTFINESGLYALIFGSKLPTAKEFKHWVTSEVLPSIRKTGSYTKQKPTSAIAAEKRATAMVINAKNRVADRMLKLYMQAEVKPEYQILALQDYFGDDGIQLPRIALKGTKVTYDKGTIAEKLGVYSNSGLPHAQAIGAIIKKLDIAEDEKEAVPYHHNGHDGTDYQYTDSVIEKIHNWLEEKGYPLKIDANGKAYSVTYQGA